MKRRTILIACLSLPLLLVMSCAGNPFAPAGMVGVPAGFWNGLWHGFTMLFTFIISLFKNNVGIYEANNTGNMYDLGFLLGVIIFFGGSSGGACYNNK
jgi:hypothetical protein